MRSTFPAEFDESRKPVPNLCRQSLSAIFVESLCPKLLSECDSLRQPGDKEGIDKEGIDKEGIDREGIDKGFADKDCRQRLATKIPSDPAHKARRARRQTRPP